MGNGMTNLYGLPDALAEALSHDEYPIHDAKTISVTQLISPPKIRQLRLRHAAEIQVDVSEQIWLLMGKAVHHVLAAANPTNRLIEERLTFEVGDWTITGQPDYFDAAGRLHDYKITSVWSAVYGIKPEWEAQINVYARMLAGYQFDVTEQKLVLILRDWNKQAAKKGGDYPPIPFAVLTPRTWDALAVDAYIADRLSIHEQAAGMADDEIPECTPLERWTKPTTYAIMKGKNKRAVRVFDTYVEAEDFMPEGHAEHWIETREGADTRCLGYCECKKYCSYGRNLVDNGSVSE